MCEPIGCEPDDVRGGRSNVSLRVRGHREPNAPAARGAELAHTTRRPVRAVEALELVEPPSFLVVPRERRNEGTCTCVAPVDAGGACWIGERGHSVGKSACVEKRALAYMRGDAEGGIFVQQAAGSVDAPH